MMSSVAEDSSGLVESLKVEIAWEAQDEAEDVGQECGREEEVSATKLSANVVQCFIGGFTIKVEITEGCHYKGIKVAISNV